MTALIQDHPIGVALSKPLRDEIICTTAQGVPYLLDLLEHGPKLLIARVGCQKIAEIVDALLLTENEMLYLGPRLYHSPLSRCERRVLRLLAQGHTNPVIAMSVGCSTQTVKTHVSAVLRKMHVSDRRHATAVYWGHALDPVTEKAHIQWLKLPEVG